MSGSKSVGSEHDAVCGTPPMRTVRSFSLRGQRLSDSAERTLERYGERFIISVPSAGAVASVAPGTRVDFEKAFGRSGSLVVEVGPGSGEQIVSSALQHPENNYLALEAWLPGVAKCVANIVRSEVNNVRVMNVDAQQALPILFGCAEEAREVSGAGGESVVSASVLSSSIGDEVVNNPGDGFAKAKEVSDSAQQLQVAELWTFFPDPWRKRKHRKRRIINPSFAYTVAKILPVGSVWRLATDWDNYAWQMRDVLEESPWFDNPYQSENCDPADEGIYCGGFAPRFEERVVTRFEERGIEAGRTTHDLCVVRNELPCDANAVPPDPWIAARERGEYVKADEGGERPPSSRRAWLKMTAENNG